MNNASLLLVAASCLVSVLGWTSLELSRPKLPPEVTVPLLTVM
jgi:hypothetical protein